MECFVIKGIVWLRDVDLLAGFLDSSHLICLTGSVLNVAWISQVTIGPISSVQVPAYASHVGSAPSGSRKVVGRYLFAKPDLGDGPAVQEASSEDGEVREAFARSLAILYAAWEAGSFFPRLFDQKGEEPRLCKSCSFSEACLRGDSAARLALGRWLESRATPRSGGAGAFHPAEEVLCAAWRIGEVKT